MENFVKPTIIVSKCLGFEACRYDGMIVTDEFVEKLKNHVNFIPICPEVEIGLGIPRNKIKIVVSKDKRKLLQLITNRDITQKMTIFVDNFLSTLQEIDGFILKAKSPSCGIRNVKIFSIISSDVPLKRGAGFFGGRVLNIFPGLATENERRLQNFKIRNHFLTKLFTLASFREAQKSQTIQDLIQFHTKNKYLLMAYNQKEMRILGRIVANNKEEPIKKVLANYEKHLKLALTRAPRYTSNINVLLHTMGYFSKDLSFEEKEFFLNTLEEYRNKTIPLRSAVNILKSWITRFENSYLIKQTFFNPYPEELSKNIDRGKD